MENWSINIEKWEEINPESAKFILEQGEKFLGQTLEIGEKISSRAFSLILILITLVSALTGYSINKYLTENVLSGLIIVNTLYILILIVILYFLFMIIFPRLTYVSGRKPSDIAIPDFLENEKPESNVKHLALVLNEIENCQFKIDANEKQNEERITQLKRCITALCISFLIYMAIMSFVLFII